MLLDTNVLIDILRGQPDAVRFVGAIRGRPSTSIICVMELVAGARSRSEEQSIDRLLRSATILPASEDIGRRAGQFLRHYRTSHGVTDPDALIAATAEHHALKLATLNAKHFPMFPKLKRAY